jgi:hypothetical protein
VASSKRPVSYCNIFTGAKADMMQFRLKTIAGTNFVASYLVSPYVGTLPQTHRKHTEYCGLLLSVCFSPHIYSVKKHESDE